MSRTPLRVWSLLLGTAWSQALLVCGFALVLTRPATEQRVIAAAALLAGGALVAMMMVIDRLVPDASRRVVIPLKLGTLLVFAGCTTLTLYRMTTGESLPLPLTLPA